MSANGYPVVYCPNNPHANSGGWAYEHILAMEEYLQRPLKHGEVVHHRDMNRTNNNPSNLMLFASKSDHTSFHQYGCDDSYVRLRSDGAYEIIDEKRHNVCPICGNKKTNGAKMCIQCYSKEGRKALRKVEWPSRSELKYLLKTQSMTSISKMYGVGFHAIERWCRHYSLPDKASVIRAMSDDEWSLL